MNHYTSHIWLLDCFYRLIIWQSEGQQHGKSHAQDESEALCDGQTALMLVASRSCMTVEVSGALLSSAVDFRQNMNCGHIQESPS